MNAARLAQMLIEGPRIVLYEDAAEPMIPRAPSADKERVSGTVSSREQPDEQEPEDSEDSEESEEKHPQPEQKPKIDKKIAVFLNRMILRIFSVPSLMTYLKDVVLFQDDQAQNGQCKIQLVFHRLPDEAHPQVVKLICAPRDPKFSRFVDKGQARTGVEMEVEPDDFGGEEYDYAF